MELDIPYGYVAGRFLAVMTEGDDPDALPDAKPLSGSLELTRLPKQINETLPEPTSAFVRPRRLQLDAQGYLVDEQGSSPVAVPVGLYAVRFLFDWVRPASFTFEVAEENTADNPVQIPLQGPIPVPPHTEFVFSEQVKLDTFAARDEAVAAAGRAEDAAEVAERVGMKEYASIAGLDAVRETEVGIVRGLDLGAISSSYAGATGDLVVTTTSLVGGSIIIQSAAMIGTSGGFKQVTISRVSYTQGSSWSQWGIFEPLPAVTSGQVGIVLVGSNDGSGPKWVPAAAEYVARTMFGDTLARRDAFGRAQFSAPLNDLDAANKKYVDDRTIKTYASAAELDAVRANEIGLVNYYSLGLPGYTFRGKMRVETTNFTINYGQQMYRQRIELGFDVFCRYFTAGAWTSWVNVAPPPPQAGPAGVGSVLGTPLTGAATYTSYDIIRGVAPGVMGDPYIALVESRGTMALYGSASQPDDVMTRKDFAKAAPASSAAAGIAGDRAYDANYLYVCVATNQWKRIPLETF